jgi:hypothetical protein
MNTRNTPVAARIAALVATVAVTTLVFASQLGLAGHYTSEADAVLAAKRVAPVAQNAGSVASQRQPT